MKTNIKIRVNEEQSKLVQEICFNNGVGWDILRKYTIMNITSKFLYIEDVITHSFSESPYSDDDFKENNYFFNEQKLEEIDPDLFIRTNGTCEENTFNELFEKVSERVNDFQIGSKFQPLDEVIRSVGKTNGLDKLATSHYTMNMLLDNLKKKNEILKKARIKRKNQREELHKLNLKLQKCISFEEHNRKIESIEFDLNMFKSSNKLRENLIEKLERDAKESIKDIKELESLNNVLKMENKSLKESSKISCNMLHGQKDKIGRLELKYVMEQSNYKKEIEKLKAVIEYLESKVK